MTDKGPNWTLKAAKAQYRLALMQELELCEARAVTLFRDAQSCAADSGSWVGRLETEAGNLDARVDEICQELGIHRAMAARDAVDYRLSCQPQILRLEDAMARAVA